MSKISNKLEGSEEAKVMVAKIKNLREEVLKITDVSPERNGMDFWEDYLSVTRGHWDHLRKELRHSNIKDYLKEQ